MEEQKTFEEQDTSVSDEAVYRSYLRAFTLARCGDHTCAKETIEAGADTRSMAAIALGTEDGKDPDRSPDSIGDVMTSIRNLLTTEDDDEDDDEPDPFDAEEHIRLGLIAPNGCAAFINLGDNALEHLTSEALMRIISHHTKHLVTKFLEVAERDEGEVFVETENEAD